MELADIIGYAAGALVIISMLPQLIKSWKTRSTRDLSLWRWLIYIVGIALWITYAIMISSWPLLAVNVIVMGIALSMLYFKLRYG